MKESIISPLPSIKYMLQVLLLTTILLACNSENSTQETSTTEQVAGSEAIADSAEFTGPAGTVNNNLVIPSDGKACNVLSQQEVKQALGITDESFRSADTTINRYGNACTYYWQKAGNVNGFMNIASVYVPPVNSAIATETAFREDLGTKGKNSIKITNLGDEAYWLNEINQLYVIKNGRWFYVSMVVGNDQDGKQTQARARALAEQIVAKL